VVDVMVVAVVSERTKPKLIQEAWIPGGEVRVARALQQSSRPTVQAWLDNVTGSCLRVSRRWMTCSPGWSNLGALLRDPDTLRVPAGPAAALPSRLQYWGLSGTNSLVLVSVA